MTISVKAYHKSFELYEYDQHQPHGGKRQARTFDNSFAFGYLLKDFVTGVFVSELTIDVDTDDDDDFGYAKMRAFHMSKNMLTLLHTIILRFVWAMFHAICSLCTSLNNSSIKVVFKFMGH